MVLSSFLLGAVLVQPSWLHTEIQGHSLNDREAGWNQIIRDQKSGWIIYKTLECDGSHRMIRLTRDYKEVKRLGGNWAKWIEGRVAQSVVGQFQVQGRDSELIRFIGEPTKVIVDGRYRRWRYIWRNVRNEKGVIWMNEYVFREGRCVEVSYHRDNYPGCGGDPNW